MDPSHVRASPINKGDILMFPDLGGTAVPVTGEEGTEAVGARKQLHWAHLVEGGEVMDRRPRVTWFIL
jgi:hypothetical protein